MPSTVIGALLAGVIAGSTAAAIGFSWAAFAGALILGGLSKALAKKPQQPNFGSQGRLFTVRQAIPPRQVVLGEARVGGALTFMHFGRSGDQLTKETHVVPAGLTVTIDHAASWLSTAFVRERIKVEDEGGYEYDDLTEVPGSPAPGEYSVAAGVYTFNIADANRTLEFGYRASSVTTDVVHLVITFAGHRCAAIGRLYFDDDLVTISTSGAVTGKYAGYVKITKSLGDEGMAQPFPGLVSESGGAWSETHLQAGCAKIWVRLAHNPDLFPNLVPNITAEVRGAVPLDRRTGATGWTSNAAVALSHYFANPAFGLGADLALEVHEDDEAAAANSCDEAVALATATATFTADATADTIALATGARQLLNGMGVRVASAGALPAGLAAATTYFAIRHVNGGFQLATSLANARAGTAINLTSAGSGVHTLTYWDEPRYTVNGSFLTSEKPVDVIQRLVAAMAGSAVNVGDQWRINAGVYHAPTVTLAENDLAGPSVIQAHVPSREDANGVKGVFTNPDVNWQPDDFPAIESDTYLAEDGGERRWKDIDLTSFVASGTQAQRIAKIDLLRMRQALSEAATFKLTAWAAVPGRTLARTDAQLGWSAKAFEIQDSELVVVEGDDGNVTLAVKQFLRETAAAVYDWSTSEEQTVDLAPNTNLPLLSDVPPPGVPGVTEELYETRDGRGVGTKAIVTWAASSYPFSPTYVLEYRSTAVSAWTILPAAGDTRYELLDLAPDRYDFRVKAVGFQGASSTYQNKLDQEIVGLGAPPATPVITGLQTYGALAVLTVEPHPDLDVRRGGRWRIRHVQDGAPVSWSGAFSIGDPDSWLGDQTVLVLPLKPGTYLVRAEDSMGVQSAAYDQIETKQASVNTFSPLSTLQEDPTFSGTHSGTFAEGGVLTLTGVGMFDDIPDLDAVADLDGFGGLATEGIYTYAAGYDHGAVGHLRVTGHTVGLVVNLLDLIDDRAGLIDDWLDFDGDTEGAGAAADIYQEYRETDDNPAGSPVWSDWKRLDATEVEARGIQVRGVLTSNDPAYRPEVTELRAKIEQLA